MDVAFRKGRDAVGERAVPGDNQIDVLALPAQKLDGLDGGLHAFFFHQAPDVGDLDPGAFFVEIRPIPRRAEREVATDYADGVDSRPFHPFLLRSFCLHRVSCLP